ncbi:hypothetical protein AZ78_3973 [Lysobacter capsici AZ78]|uniref:Uncharacterized protein n=2 Tax=Lysobacter capsici TaxID=435897 RepID=A0A108UC63_9GAMM|nr:hypothetical protein AZ78_3973 [Lysobacter capsici AZ78]
MAACNSGNAASEAAAATAPAEAAPATTAAPDANAQAAAMPAAAPAAADSATIVKNTEAAVSKGMAYADFRKAVLAQGWQPLVDAQCRANVIGGNYEKVCAKNPARCQICDDVPELNACSGDAHCLMQFTHAGVEGALKVTGYGEIKDWNVSGKDSGLQVSGWEVGKVEAAD